MVSGSPVNKRSFEAGIARTENPLTTPVTDYYHGDLIGTTRLMSDPSGGSIEPAVYTAFGDRITGPTTTDASRYGYVGAWGYQQHADFPYMHVGARYYDPSSGRFLQRDPIGIEGNINVYEYADGLPTSDVDPEGMQSAAPAVSPGGAAGLVNPKAAKEVAETLLMIGCMAGAAKKAKDTVDKEKEKEHTKDARPSTKDKHEKGKARKGKDQGGEKGDARRPYRRK